MIHGAGIGSREYRYKVSYLIVQMPSGVEFSHFCLRVNWNGVFPTRLIFIVECSGGKTGFSSAKDFSFNSGQIATSEISVSLVLLDCRYQSKRLCAMHGSSTCASKSMERRNTIGGGECQSLFIPSEV